MIALAAVSGVAQAKGNLVEIRISGGGLDREVGIVATNQDFASGWGAPQRSRSAGFYTVTYFVAVPGEGRTFPTIPMRYYPAHGGRPAVFMQDDGSDWNHWVSPPAPLARRLDVAIAAARAGRSIPHELSRSFVTSWAGVFADVLVVVTCGAGIAVVRRRRFRRGSVPAPEGLASAPSPPETSEGPERT